MFEKSVDGKTTKVTVRPPLVYLDHCGVRNISRDQTLRDEFVAIFAERGTLLFSMMNILEAARNSEKSHDEMREFLDRLGPHWIPCESDPEIVASNEARGVPPPRTFMMRLDLLAPVLRAATDTFLLGTAVATLHAEVGFRERAPELLSGGRDRHALLQTILQARERHRRGEKFPELKIPKHSVRWIELMLSRRLATSGKTLDANDVNDLFHATVALASAHVIVLDSAWAEFGRSLRLDQTRVFSGAPNELPKALQAVRDYRVSSFRLIEEALGV